MLVWVRKVMCLGDQQTEVKVLAGLGSCWRWPGTHRSMGVHHGWSTKVLIPLLIVSGSKAAPIFRVSYQLLSHDQLITKPVTVHPIFLALPISDVLSLWSPNASLKGSHDADRPIQISSYLKACWSMTLFTAADSLSINTSIVTDWLPGKRCRPVLKIWIVYLGSS